MCQNTTLPALLLLVASCFLFQNTFAQQLKQDKQNNQHHDHKIPEHRTCGTMDYLNDNIAENPTIIEQMKVIEQHTAKFVAQQQNKKSAATVITIPTVVHVLYSNSAQNISMAQINSQMQVLNDDFRRMNADASSTPSAFLGVAADTEIEFCLATIDPNGNATNGITRTSTSVSAFSTGSGCGSGQPMKFDAYGGKDAWPTDQYLNMWVCNLGGGTLGYAQFPGSGCAATDGVVMGYTYFGTTGAAQAPFDGGRTTTHEVGHWLNLRHIWGDGNCSMDDFVSDTPTSDAPNYGCSPSHVSCSSTDMVQNYMDYSDDGCMNLFTQGQKTRMRAVLTSGGFRASLVNSNGCGATTPSTCNTPTGLGATPANDQASLSWSSVSGATSYNIEARQAGATSWSSGSTASNSINYTGLSVCTNYEFRIQAVCSGGATSSYSAIYSFSTTGCGGGGSGYCASTGNTSDEWIQSVQIGSINNNSGNDNGYQDFTSQSTSAEQGETVNVTLTPGFSGSAYAEYWRIWIDYNADLDFDDAGELVYDAGSTNTSAVSASFTVSGSAPLGSTRMRVSMKYNASSAPCETLNYGEVEDYTIDITAPTTTTCSIPTGLGATPNTTDASLSWSAVSGATSYNVRARVIGGGSWSSGTVTGTSVNYTGLNTCSNYEFQVEADCGGTTSGFSSSFNFMTTGCGGGGGNTYCTHSGGDVTDEWIAGVNVGTINNTSGADGGYGDYTSSTPTDLEQGTAYNVTLTPGYASTAYTEYWRIWIDYNQDGDFTDSGELAYDAGSGQSNAVNGSFTVPAVAALGNTRMRVAMKWVGNLSSGGSDTAPPDECGSFGYGEVEDYTVNIIAPTSNGNTYCTHSGGNTTDEWIASISIGTINNSTGDDGGYADYTTINTDLAQGATENFTLTTGYAGSAYNEYWRIWIDYNQDGDFTDAGELAYDAGGGNPNSVSGSITVPSNASLGSTRMRVAMKWVGNLTGGGSDTAPPDECGSFGYGEVEDYTVNIIVPTVVCDVPTGLNASANNNDATVSWSPTANAGSYNVQYRLQGTSSWTTITVSSGSTTITGLTNCSNYEFRVESVCGATTSGYSSAFAFSTTGCISGVCAASGNQYNTNFEWISNVTFENINNSSANSGGYVDYTANVADVEQGGTYNISISAGFASNPYDEIYAVYIDFNHNDDFTDAGELAFSTVATGGNTATGTITIPSNAHIGSIKMRVMQKAGNNVANVPPPCGTYHSGEVEDYTLNVMVPAPPSSGPTYCTSQGNNVSDEWIADVTFGSFNNASGANGGYGDFTNLTANLQQGGSYALSLSPGYAGQTWAEYWRIYIDYNQDGDFTDAGELAFDAGSNSTTTVTGSVIVPSGATLGDTRMRVIMKYMSNTASAPTSCETFSYGEVEDYTVNISSGGGGPSVTYCSAAGANTQYEWIDNVSLAAINNTSGSDGGYGDYTSISTGLSAGTSVNVSLTPGFASGSYDEYWHIYIDYNQDGDFTDAGELAYSSGASQSTVNGTINVPSGASNGNTRMRVMMRYNTAPTDACTGFNDGEVEDYTIVISGGILKTAFNNASIAWASNLILYPNPAKERVTVAYNLADNETIQVNIYDVTGKLVSSQQQFGQAGVNQLEMDIAHLNNGYYLLRLESGEKTISRKLMVAE